MMKLTKSKLKQVIREETENILKENIAHPSLWLRNAASNIRKVVLVKEHPNLTEEDRLRLSELEQELTAMAERVAGWGDKERLEENFNKVKC